jgi:CBS domain containing-hemolysin-like protein
VSLWTFVLSAALNSGSGAVAGSLDLGFSIAVLITIVGAGILFDIVGTAAAAATEAPLNAMAAKRVYGAPEALALVKNAPAVASFCSDFVGDICGTVSGAVGATIMLRFLATGIKSKDAVASSILVATVAAVTVGGKAAGKRLAIESADQVMLTVGRIAAAFARVTGISIVRGRRNPRRRQ